MGIHEVINQLEQMRKNRNLLNIISICCFVAYVIAQSFAEYSFDYHELLMGGSFFFLGVGAICLAMQKKMANEYKKIYKETFVKGILNEQFDNVEYYGERGFDTNAVKEFGLTKLGNIFKSEDYLRAKYKGINFVQADVTIQYKTYGKNSHTTTYFKGRMFAFEVPEKRVLSVQLFSNNFNYRAGTISKFKANKIQMESEYFNREFDIKSVNSMDAFLVLTPPMMEKINKIKSTYGNVGMHFCGNKLYVGINMSGDAFDGDIKRKIDYFEEKQATMRDLNVIKDIIDTIGMENEIPDNTDNTIKYSIPYNR